MKAIVMAGGGGTRLWPLSREDFPKQFLNFGSGLSLLQRSVERLARASFIDEIVVATNTLYSYLVEQQLGKLDLAQKVKILVEPLRRNTAPAIGLAVKYLQCECAAKESDCVVVLPSDHLIDPEAIFLHALEQMERISSEKIVTFGIRPTKPETGYGYIQIGSKFNALTFEASKFVEKPNRETSEKYINDARYYWNAGVFIFVIDAFWNQLKKYSPDLFGAFQGTYIENVSKFHLMPDLSIDYALMEKSREILVCPLAVSWTDVGCWDSVYDAMEKDPNQNVKVGEIFDVDTKNSLIFGGKRLISTVGVENLLIVETEDALFVSKKGESQKVKAIVKELLQKGKRECVLHLAQNHSWGTVRSLECNDAQEIQKFLIFPGMTLKYRAKSMTKEQWIPLQNGGSTASSSLTAFNMFSCNGSEEISISNSETYPLGFIVVIDKLFI